MWLHFKLETVLKYSLICIRNHSVRKKLAVSFLFLVKSMFWDKIELGENISFIRTLKNSFRYIFCMQKSWKTNSLKLICKAVQLYLNFYNRQFRKIYACFASWSLTLSKSFLSTLWGFSGFFPSDTFDLFEDIEKSLSLSVFNILVFRFTERYFFIRWYVDFLYTLRNVPLKEKTKVLFEY